ncbi:MAG: hypothetical protein L0229_02575 [Blastocatellia bacterium]|nr:hypothetical protein [Blastocatellia bacterium]
MPGTGFHLIVPQLPLYLAVMPHGRMTARLKIDYMGLTENDKVRRRKAKVKSKKAKTT